MFLLGHSCWSYLTSKLTGQALDVKLPAWLALLSGILPDYDIFFGPVGLVHHTWTHSIVILVPIVAVLTVYYGRLGFAFGIGMLSHLLTDSLVGTIPILFPFLPNTIGLSLGIPSVADTFLETGSLALVLVYGYWNQDYKQLTRPDRKSLWLVVPLYSILVLSIVFAVDTSISLSTLAFSRKALSLITVGHGIECSLLAIGVLQGIGAIWMERKTRPGEKESVAEGSVMSP